MEKTVFNDKTFHALLLIGLGVILCWNLFTFSVSLSLIGLIPIVVQVIVLALLLVKHRYAKMAIKIWSILLIVGPSLSIIGKTIQVLVGDEILDKIGPLIIDILMLFAGLTIHHYNNTTVDVKKMDANEGE